MPDFIRGDIRLAYEIHGSGQPVLLIAPGGLRSERGMWRNSPLDPVALLSPHFQVVAMDQRNAGASSGPIEADHTWDTYTEDQLALMSHLGHEKFAVVGMCIGGPYILNLLKIAPERVTASVVMQTIGRDNNYQEFLDMFNGWSESLQVLDPQRFSGHLLEPMRARMLENDLTFMCMTEVDVQALSGPMLILDGNDTYHPASSSERLAALQPQAQRIERWKQEPDLQLATEVFQTFLQQHSAVAS